MFDFARSAALGAVAAVSLAAGSASAVTLDPASNIFDGGTYDIAAGPFYHGTTFSGTDVAGSYEFTFENNSAVSKVLAVSIGTVIQGFVNLNGVTAEWVNAGTSAFVPASSFATDMFKISSTIAAGASDILRITHGNPTGTGKANIDLVVAAIIPLPAGGLLLLTALGGVALLRRRKTA
ncbi:MAG: VPLPA-CTERM sorting domain-containing protein [Gemmobacter sp.]